VTDPSPPQPLTGLLNAIAIEVAVPLPQQRLGFGVGADLLAGEPVAVPRQGQPEAMPPGAHGLILDAALGLAEGCGGCAPDRRLPAPPSHV